MEDEICDLLFLFGDDTDPLFNVEAEDEVIQDNTAEVPKMLKITIFRSDVRIEERATSIPAMEMALPSSICMYLLRTFPTISRPPEDAL